MAEDVYIQRLRGLGTWWRLGSSALEPLLLVHYASVRPPTWARALHETEVRATDQRAVVPRHGIKRTVARADLAVVTNRFEAVFAKHRLGLPEQSHFGRPTGGARRSGSAERRTLADQPLQRRFLLNYYGDKGVEMRMGEGLACLRPRAGRAMVVTTTGREFEADILVAGLGIRPNVELAEQGGLTVENGIVVDQFLRTSDPDIYAAGDVANFPNPALATRIRVEHEDNANKMGQHAGRNMAGAAAPYDHLPFFYSDLFELGYEAVGDLDVRHETVGDWKEPFREGVVYYLKDGRVRGVLLWNVWGRLHGAAPRDRAARWVGRADAR